MKKNKVLVIGDVMLDCYRFTNTIKISDEAPVLVVKQVKEENILGGASNVASNLSALELDVSLFGVIGIDAKGKIIKRLLKEQKIKDYIIEDNHRPTTIKLRILCREQQLIRFDREITEEVYFELPKNNFDMIVVSDYNKGVINKNTINKLWNLYREIPKIVNGKPENIELYKKR